MEIKTGDMVMCLISEKDWEVKERPKTHRGRPPDRGEIFTVLRVFIDPEEESIEKHIWIQLGEISINDEPDAWLFDEEHFRVLDKKQIDKYFKYGHKLNFRL